VAFVDRDQDTLWVSSLRRGKWATARWSQAFGVSNVVLWPTASDCTKTNRPWYTLQETPAAKNAHVSFFTKRDHIPSWSLTLGSNTEQVFCKTFANPYAECIMLDCKGKMMGKTEQRPWSIP
jgi:hypothetical protein